MALMLVIRCLGYLECAQQVKPWFLDIGTLLCPGAMVTNINKPGGNGWVRSCSIVPYDYRQGAKPPQLNQICMLAVIRLALNWLAK